MPMFPWSQICPLEPQVPVCDAGSFRTLRDRWIDSMRLDAAKLLVTFMGEIAATLCAAALPEAPPGWPSS